MLNIFLYLTVILPRRLLSTATARYSTHPLDVDFCQQPHSTRSTSALKELMGTLKPHSSGVSYSNTVIGTLAVDGWASYVWYGPARAAAPPSPLFAVTNVTAHPSMTSVPTSYYSK